MSQRTLQIQNNTVTRGLSFNKKYPSTIVKAKCFGLGLQEVVPYMEKIFLAGVWNQSPPNIVTNEYAIYMLIMSYLFAAIKYGII